MGLGANVINMEDTCSLAQIMSDKISHNKNIVAWEIDISKFNAGVIEGNYIDIVIFTAHIPTFQDSRINVLAWWDVQLVSDTFNHWFCNIVNKTAEI